LKNQFIESYRHFIHEAFTWSEIRDAIQTKKPFVILIFKNRDNYKKCLSKELQQYDTTLQTAILQKEGQLIKYPSCFFLLTENQKFEAQLKRIIEKYKLKYAILGSPGSEFAKLYAEGGTSSEFGNEIISTLDPNEFIGEEYFKIGSTYYRFINHFG
jgi:hypothetical protein